MNEKTALEKISGSLPVQTALTLASSLAVSGTSGAILAPLLPLLASSVAMSRQEKRIEENLEKINLQLKEHSEVISKLNDSNLYFIQNTATTILNTIDPEKFEYLQLFIKGALTSNEVMDGMEYQLSRVIRDISAQELKFLVDIAEKEFIGLSNHKLRHEEINHHLEKGAFANLQESSGEIVNGLINLGLLIQEPGSSGGFNTYLKTNLSKKLVSLIKMN